MDRLRPLWNKALQRLGVDTSLVARAVRTRVVQQGSVEQLRPVIVLPGELERAKKIVPGENTLESSIRYLRSTSVEHLPVVEYVVEDALVHSSGVDVWGAGLAKKRYDLGSLRPRAIENVDRAIYCMDAVSQERFGHWLTDVCTVALLAEPDQRRILDVRTDWTHAVDYADIFGYSSAPDLARVRSLSIYSDPSQGSSKRQRYKVLRDRMTSLRSDHVSRSSRVYLRRGTTGDSRVIENEDEITRCLESLGFDVIDMEALPVRELYNRTCEAELIVSMDGSHIAHMYFMAPSDTRLIVIVPDDRFVDIHRGYCDCVGFRYGMMVCEKTGGGYHVDTGRLEKTIHMAAEAE